MFIKLTFYDGSLFRIRPELIENYGFDGYDGANAYVSTANGNYRVKDTVEEIDSMLESKKRMALNRPIRIDGQLVVRQEIHKDFPKYGRYVRIDDEGASELIRIAISSHMRGTE